LRRFAVLVTTGYLGATGLPSSSATTTAGRPSPSPPPVEHAARLRGPDRPRSVPDIDRLTSRQLLNQQEVGRPRSRKLVSPPGPTISERQGRPSSGVQRHRARRRAFRRAKGRGPPRSNRAVAPSATPEGPKFKTGALVLPSIHRHGGRRRQRRTAAAWKPPLARISEVEGDIRTAFATRPAVPTSTRWRRSVVGRNERDRNHPQGYRERKRAAQRRHAGEPIDRRRTVRPRTGGRQTGLHSRQASRWSRGELDRLLGPFALMAAHLPPHRAPVADPSVSSGFRDPAPIRSSATPALHTGLDFPRPPGRARFGAHRARKPSSAAEIGYQRRLRQHGRHRPTATASSTRFGHPVGRSAVRVGQVCPGQGHDHRSAPARPAGPHGNRTSTTRVRIDDDPRRPESASSTPATG